MFNVFEKRTMDKENDKTKRTPGRSDAEGEDARRGAAVGSGGLHVLRS